MSDPKTELFRPFSLGKLELPNRLVMAPLTRSRASQPGDVPNAMNAEYYGQRASAGLIISEATQVSPQGKGYAFTPGIHSPEQVDGWRLVTEAVHEAGGRIHAQLWHVGRISRPELQPDGEQPVAPSAIKPEGAQTFISAESGMVDVLEPRALEISEMPDIIDQYRQAAKNARDAGFDGIEIHCANGYLLDQFIRSETNRRTDAYGGSLENRLRLPLEVLDAVLEVWPKDAVGVRVSPTGSFNDIRDSDPVTTFGGFAQALNERDIAYIEVVEDSFQGNHASGRPEEVIDAIRDGFKGNYIANGAYTPQEAAERIAQGRCDLVSFGRSFIANPDFPERVRRDAPMNEPDYDTFYGGDERGYTDYPTLKQLETA